MSARVDALAGLQALAWLGALAWLDALVLAEAAASWAVELGWGGAVGVVPGVAHCGAAQEGEYCEERACSGQG